MDWKSLIADLKACGWSQPHIAEEVSRSLPDKCGQATINELATGKTKQPRFPLGLALISLHKKAMAKARAAEKAGA